MSSLNHMGLSLFPYQYLSSRVISAAASATASTSTPTFQPPSFLGNVILQFSKQLMRPRIMIPTLIIIVLLFDLDDDMMNIDEDFLLSDDEEEE